MKATGIVRRIDDLGRVVVPKEIRRTLRIREGDPLEIFTNREGGIILKKYSPIGELGELAAEYVEAVAQVAKCTVCVADRDMIVAVSGPAKREFHGQNIHADLIRFMEERGQQIAVHGEHNFCKITEDENEVYAEAISTIVAEGDAIGAVILLSKDPNGSLRNWKRKWQCAELIFSGNKWNSKLK